MFFTNPALGPLLIRVGIWLQTESQKGAFQGRLWLRKAIHTDGRTHGRTFWALGGHQKKSVLMHVFHQSRVPSVLKKSRKWIYSRRSGHENGPESRRECPISPCEHQAGRETKGLPPRWDNTGLPFGHPSRSLPCSQSDYMRPPSEYI